jgi:signal transduction histidine kinase/ligand-binding sensor domain-containing protein/DNA-binding response OmpR family regulator
MHKSVLLFVLICFNSLCFAQANGLSTRYTSDNGLLNNNITCITQDSKGYMWIGTSDGLMRFDGYGFTSFFHSDNDSTSIIGAEILDIHEDKSSNLWIATALGLSCYDHALHCFHNFTKFREGKNAYSNYITGVVDANDGKLWVATSYGIHLFDPQTLSFQIFTFKDKSLSDADANYIKKVVKDKAGNLWLGLINGELVYFNTVTHNYSIYSKHIDKHNTNKQDYRLTSLIVDKNNYVWAGFQNRGLVCFNNTGVIVQMLSKQCNNLPDNNIVCLGTSNKNELLIGTNGSGIVSLSNGNKYTLQCGFGTLSSSKIAAIFYDKQGDYWIAYVSGGLEVFYSRFNQFNSSRYPDDAIPSKNKTVLDVCIDHSNNLWLACDANGLFKINRTTGQTTHFYTNLKNNFPSVNEAVTTVFEDSHGIIWVGSYTGGLTAIYSSGKIVNYRNSASDKHSISGNSIKDITEDKQGKIWMTVDSRGFSMLDMKTQSFTNYNIDSMFGTSWKNWTFNIIHRDSFVLVSTNDGIVSYNLKTRKAKNYLADSDVKNKYRIGVIPYSFFDSKNRLWLATKNGLVLYNIYTNSFKVFSVKDGFSANSITSITEDRNGNLWLGTFQGLIRFNPDTRKVNNFTIQDGLQGNQFNYGACYTSSKGELVFGGTNGFTSFNSDSIKLNPFKPLVDITGFRISNVTMLPKTEGSPLRNDISCTDTIVLKYKQSNIGFSFTALNLVQTDKNQYAYILKGFDKDWITLGKIRQANYTNLSSGSYRFIVKASNNDGIWNETGKSILIIIKPPFWLTVWAYLFYGLLIALILYFFRKFTIININEKHRLTLEHIEKEKQEAIYQHKVEFFTEISHEIRTPLTLIIDPIERLITADKSATPTELLSIHRNVKKLYNLINQLLDFRKVEASTELNLTTSDFVAFVSHCMKDFEPFAIENKINLNLQSELSQFEFAFDSEKMEKVISNLLSNAIKHTPSGGFILLNIKFHEPSAKLEFSVTNNGKGIQPEHLQNIFTSFYKADTYTQGSGLGLAIVKTLVEQHSGTISVTSIPDEETRFTIFFPYTKPSFKANISTNAIVQNNEKLIEILEKPILLLVEDNDEIRSYIKSLFSKTFQIVEAENGEIAWNKTKEILPDIIISDIMMPVMDGKTFCLKVNSDSMTNHIPVILLTAQSLDDQKVTGLSTGAVDYIIKPFKSQELELKVANIITSQANLKASIKKQVLFSPSIQQPETDNERFIKKAEETILKHLANTSFDIELFASEMCYSSRQLRRKLQSLTGITPVEMIRDIRLKHSLELLKQQKYSISEIGDMVGFNDQKYFSKQFQILFGYTPSDFLKQLKG